MPSNIVDVLLEPTGNPELPAVGVDITLTQEAFVSGNNFYPAFRLDPHPVSDALGNINIWLEPNVTGQPYQVLFRQTNGVITREYWNVPVSGSPLKIKDVRSTVGPAPNLVMPWSQITGIGAGLGAGPYSAYMPNPSYPPAYVINAASSGDRDLYTVPAGRKALLLGWVTTNPSSTIQSFLETKISGSYYRLTQGSANSGNFGQDELFNVDIPPKVLNAGETLSISMNNAGLSTWAHLVEFDASSPLRSVTLTSPAFGHNTLYTVPVSKTFEVLPTFGTDNNVFYFGLRSRLFCTNLSNPQFVVNAYAVPSGGTPSASNQIASGIPVANTSTLIALYGSLAPGDFIDVQVTSGNASGQMVWLNIIEH